MQADDDRDEYFLSQLRCCSGPASSGNPSRHLPSLAQTSVEEPLHDFFATLDPLPNDHATIYHATVRISCTLHSASRLSLLLSWRCILISWQVLAQATIMQCICSRARTLRRGQTCLCFCPVLTVSMRSGFASVQGVSDSKVQPAQERATHDEAQPGLTSMQGTDAAPAPVACMYPHTGAAAVAASMAAGAADAAQAIEPVSMTRDTATSADTGALPPSVHISVASSSHAGAISASNTPKHKHTARTTVQLSEHSSPAIPARHSGQSALLVPRMTRGDSDVLLDDIIGATFSSPEPSPPGSTGSAERRAKAELARKRCWPDPHSPSKRRRLDMPRVNLARVQQQEAYVYDTMRMLDAATTMEHWTAAQNIARAREAHIAQVEAECARADEAVVARWKGRDRMHGQIKLLRREKKTE